MTVGHLHKYERRVENRRAAIDHIMWEPQLPRRIFRRATWERATILDVSLNGARIRAHTNDLIERGTRITIGMDKYRGLVEVRRIEPGPNAMTTYYGVRFLWLDAELQAVFDDAVQAHDPVDLVWLWDVTA